MCTTILNIIAGEFDMDINVLRARSKTMTGMGRSIKTSLGVSATSYGNCTREPQTQIYGEYQGKGDVDVASLWVMQSSTILAAHASLYSGIILPHITSSEHWPKNNDVNVDDTNTWAASCEWHWGYMSTHNVIDHIAHGAQ